VGLNEILVAFDAEPAAAERADYPRGHSLAEPERIADGEDKIADLKPRRITHRYRGQADRWDLQHRNVGARIPADQPCPKAPVVLGRDLDIVGMLGDMTVGQHVTARGIDDDPRPGRLGLALDRPVSLQSEKAAEHRVLQERVLRP